MREESIQPYSSATFLQLSRSPPVTSIHLSFKAEVRSLPWTSSAKGVWLWINMLVSRGSLSALVSSATRSVSCLPPPLVRRMNGMRFRCRTARASWARGRALELRRSTPSMLQVRQTSFRFRDCCRKLTRKQRQNLESWHYESKESSWHGFVDESGALAPDFSSQGTVSSMSREWYVLSGLKERPLRLRQSVSIFISRRENQLVWFGEA